MIPYAAVRSSFHLNGNKDRRHVLPPVIATSSPFMSFPSRTICLIRAIASSGLAYAGLIFQYFWRSKPLKLFRGFREAKIVAKCLVCMFDGAVVRYRMIAVGMFDRIAYKPRRADWIVSSAPVSAGTEARPFARSSACSN